MALSSMSILSALALSPMVFAADTNTAPTVRINGDGIVQVTNAEVTSISGNIINAITRFKNSVTAWTFTTNASTTIIANPKASSTATFAIGDRLKVTGALSAIGSTISVNATKIKEMASFTVARGTSGTVQSINVTAGTFVIKSDNKLVTVLTNASTTFTVVGTTTPLTLASLTQNSKVKVMGTMNGTRTIIIATSVVVKTENQDRDHDDEKDDDNRKNKRNKGEDRGLKNGWKDKEDRDNSGEHRGFLKTNINVGLKTEDR